MFQVRSKKAQEKVNLNIQVPPELIERLETHARRNEISRTAPLSYEMSSWEPGLWWQYA